MTESSPSTDTFASNQATVTVTDEDGTSTSQTFFMNVTNVNDAFGMSSGTLSVYGDVYDGGTLEAGYMDNVVTSYDAEITTTYSAPGSYDFSYVMESWFVGGFNGWAVNIAIDGVTECQTGGSSLSYATANFFCSFTMAAGETASITYYPCLLYTSPSPRD